jgi:hypothetical protein
MRTISRMLTIPFLTAPPACGASTASGGASGSVQGTVANQTLSVSSALATDTSEENCVYDAGGQHVHDLRATGYASVGAPAAIRLGSRSG